MNSALIFANGDMGDGPALAGALEQAVAADHPLIIAVDGGLRHVDALHRIPDVVIGDFDSVDFTSLKVAQQAGAETIQLPTHKDETDLEAALKLVAARGCRIIRIIGAYGERLDQVMANLYLLSLPELRQRDVQIIDGRQTAWLAYPGTTILHGAPGDTVSLLPLRGDVEGIETGELEYPLRRETLSFGPARGVSNVMLTPTARVSFEAGLLLIVHTVGRA
ncbi:MAG TPA: thiamine diphosphokinase [Aggregatilineales bacterium]|nr:thiamine diphosphokinase [Aggregatilineales bacterium]